MIDRILARLGLCRTKNVIEGILYIRDIEQALELKPMSDRHLRNVSAIAHGYQPHTTPPEEKLLKQHRLDAAVRSAKARRAMG